MSISIDNATDKGMVMVSGSKLTEDNCTELSRALNVAHIKPIYWLFPVGSKVGDIYYS